MDIRIESPQFPTTNALSSYLRRRLRDHLPFGTERIREVEAHLSDVNGRRGGRDKRCRLIVRLFAKWLCDERESRVARARAVLVQQRAREVASSFLAELFKQEGFLTREAPLLAESFLLESRNSADPARSLPRNGSADETHAATRRGEIDP